MPSPPVVLTTRVRGGFYPGSSSAFTPPALSGGTITLGSPVAGRAYMPYPAGQGDLTWQGGQFGLSAPASGGLTANVWRVSITISHFVSAPAAFSGVTAQVYDAATSTVIASAPFTLSASMITETVIATGGFPAADVPQLAARLTWHQTGVGFAAVQHAYAEVSYSYSDSIGHITIAGTPVMAAPHLNVTPPPVALVSAGAVGANLTPSFGQPTTAGDLLLGWAYSNSGSSSFDTTVSDPSWTLARSAGAAFGWESLWYKPRCRAAETAPVFSSPGATQPLSQLLEFSGAGDLDQSASASGNNSITFTAGGADGASGDLVFAFTAWNGSNAGPATITMSGTDSSGAALALSQADNHATTGTQFWVTGWAQASAAAGPGADSVTSALGVFAGGGGVLASFRAVSAGSPAAPVPAFPRSLARAVMIPVRSGMRRQ